MNISDNYVRMFEKDFFSYFSISDFFSLVLILFYCVFNHKNSSFIHPQKMAFIDVY